MYEREGRKGVCVEWRRNEGVFMCEKERKKDTRDVCKERERVRNSFLFSTTCFSTTCSSFSCVETMNYQRVLVLVVTWETKISPLDLHL